MFLSKTQKIPSRLPPKKKVRKFRFWCRSFCWSLWEFRIDHCILRDGVDGILPVWDGSRFGWKKGRWEVLGGNWICRWWFSTHFSSLPLPGDDDPIFTNIFQMGWFNHQLDSVFYLLWIVCVMERFPCVIVQPWKLFFHDTIKLNLRLNRNHTQKRGATI